MTSPSVGTPSGTAGSALRLLRVREVLDGVQRALRRRHELALHVRVDLRRRQGGVAEQRLHGTQIRPGLQEVRGVAVSQRVGGRLLLDPRGDTSALAGPLTVDSCIGLAGSALGNSHRLPCTLGRSLRQ